MRMHRIDNASSKPHKDKKLKRIHRMNVYDEMPAMQSIRLVISINVDHVDICVVDRMVLQ